MVTYKKHLNLEEMVDYLSNTKNVTFDNEEDDKQFLYEHNYINVITPFKYIFAKKDLNGNILKINNKHVYENEVNFNEYKQKYLKERSKYINIFNNISIFEVAFNSIISYEVINFYHIDSYLEFINFKDELINNCVNSKYNSTVRNHMISTFSTFESEFKKYESVYIFLDRVSLNTLVSIFRCMDNKLKIKVFNEMQRLNLTFGYTLISLFDEQLTRLVQIRNYICHSDSITILIRYFNIKNKKLRNRTDQRKFVYLLNELDK